MRDLCGGTSACTAAPGERYAPLASRLFKAGKTVEAVQKKWNFAKIVEKPPKWSEFFVFSFADLAEMNGTLRAVLAVFPTSFCMFIPGSYVKAAFEIMAKVYKNLSKRNASQGHEKRFESTYQFIVSLQRTLMRLLKVPIPLFVHL
jgi:hypothetical protein